MARISVTVPFRASSGPAFRPIRAKSRPFPQRFLRIGVVMHVFHPDPQDITIILHYSLIGLQTRSMSETGAFSTAKRSFQHSVPFPLPVLTPFPRHVENAGVSVENIPGLQIVKPVL